jgi:hypothetical protein
LGGLFAFWQLLFLARRVSRAQQVEHLLHKLLLGQQVLVALLGQGKLVLEVLGMQGGRERSSIGRGSCGGSSSRQRTRCYRGSDYWTSAGQASNW